MDARTLYHDPDSNWLILYEGDTRLAEVFIDVDIENGKGRVTVHDYLLGAVRSYSYRLRLGGFLSNLSTIKKSLTFLTPQKRLNFNLEFERFERFESLKKRTRERDEFISNCIR